MLKELLYTGMGAAVLAKEKVEQELKKLEKDGKIKTDDAKNFLDSIEKKGKAEDDKIKEHFKKALKEVIDELDIATKDDLKKLEKNLKEERK